MWLMHRKGGLVVPMNINGDDRIDLLSYNATTGQAVFSVATDVPGGLGDRQSG